VSALPPSGSIELAVGQVSGHIDFPSFLPADFAFGPLYVEHLTEPNPIPMRPIPGARTIVAGGVIGVAFTLTAVPDQTGYILRWGIA
jgi:hypothetical protein